MKWLAVFLLLLAWFAAVGFTSWVLYRNGHPVWACVVALCGVATVNLTEMIR